MQNHSLRLAETILNKFLPTRRLTLHRLTSIVYLCDWKHLLDYNHQITNCMWWVTDNTIKSSMLETELKNWPKIKFNPNLPNRPIEVTSQIEDKFEIGSSQMNTIMHIHHALHTLSDFNIETTILSTYPFKYNGLLDLKGIAEEYKPIYAYKFPRPHTA